MTVETIRAQDVRAGDRLVTSQGPRDVSSVVPSGYAQTIVHTFHEGEARSHYLGPSETVRVIRP